MANFVGAAEFDLPSLVLVTHKGFIRQAISNATD